MAMMHDLPLISTLALGLSGAFVFGLIAAKLRIPPIVGYLLAGILVGPHTPGFVADISLAEQLAEIGIVLLMFGVGLHFSLNDLMEVKGIAIPGAIGQIAAATAMGAGLGWLWGWPLSGGLLFGLALSVASTVVLLRALDNYNLLQSANGRIAIGWLIVEDIVMILALVLIPALATQSSEGQGASVWIEHLLLAIGKIGAFIVFMLVVGRRILPWILHVVAETRSRELFTLVVFAVAVGVSFGASQIFGVSLALGAFFAGMMIRESDMNHEVANRAMPFQDAFAVLFFVSVGMLFDPVILVQQPLTVALIVTIIMIGKSVAAFLIVMMFGYPVKTGLLVSAGLAQIGEFSFILVNLGLSYNLLPEEGKDLLLAGAMISIALNPVAFSGAKLIYSWAERHPRFTHLFNMHNDDLTHLRADETQKLRDLVLLVGWGRVGKYISENLPAENIDLVIIDDNRERVEQLRARGFHAIAGDATHQETLHDAAISKAFAIMVVVPDSISARQIVEHARTLKPGIKILVRAENDEEFDYYTSQNINLPVTGQREMGRAMIDYLRHPDGEARII